MAIFVCVGLFGLTSTPASAAKEDVRFDINPRHGQARIILFIEFDACRRRQVDPWSPDCGDWDNVVHNQLINKRGKYCVYARWGNREHRGGFTMLAGGSAIVYPVTPQDSASKGTC